MPAFAVTMPHAPDLIENGCCDPELSNFFRWGIEAQSFLGNLTMGEDGTGYLLSQGVWLGKAIPTLGRK